MTTCPKCNLPLQNNLCEGCLFQLASNYPKSQLSAGDANNPSIEELNASFPQFEIKRLIGRGGMGMIYHARQTNLERDVAIKIIDRRFPRDSEFFGRFEREAKALAKLSHPNVVTIFDYGHTENGQAYLVMEYVHGLNLREAMEAMSIELDEAISIVKQLCIALQYAHSKGVVHRDIKPENILLGEDGTVKIADFGIARIVETDGQNRLTATQQVLGTFHYLAPEQIESPSEADHRVDIYALGVILYELLTRKLPVGNFEHPSQLVETLDRQLDAIVLKTLNRRPTARFQTADELRRAIENVPMHVGRQPSDVPTIEPIGSVSPSRHSAVVSVPFEAEDMAGFAEVLGSILTTSDGFRLEYRVRDSIFGTLKSKVRTIDIAWDEIARIEFRCGAFKGKFSIVGNSISTLKNFPGSETGRIEVNVKRANYELADKLLDRVRAVAPSIVPTDKAATGQRQPFNAMIALTLIFFAILNAGNLAILQIIFASELDGMPLAICAVAAAVMLGPILVTQLISGLIYITAGSREAARIGTMASMFPVSPIALLYIPFGMKTLKWLDNGIAEEITAPQALQPQSKPKGWGATTLVFIRDARNARLITLLETLGTAAVFGGIAVFFFGLYPSRMQYRIVGQASQDSIGPAIQKRLRGIQGASIKDTDETQFKIACWQFQQSAIAERLSLSTPPTIRFLVPSSESDRSEDDVYLPSTVDPANQSFVSRTSGAGVELLSRRGTIELKEELVGRISVDRENQIAVDLSKAGSSSMQSMLKDYSSRCDFGLEIDGWIEGIATQKKVQDQTFLFELSKTSKHTAQSIQSAIRGPSLPFELEWVK